MGRPKEFDRDAVLLRAVEAFWERGYEGTSVQVLVNRMGIHRASLYDTYGSKEQLFREALDRYHQVVRERYEPILSSDDEPIAVVRRLFEAMIDELTSVRPASEADAPPAPPRQCLMVKSAMSVPVELDGVRERVVEHFRWLRERIQEHLDRAAEGAHLEPDTKTEALAQHLVDTLVGIISCSSIWRDKERLVRHAELALERTFQSASARSA